LNVFNYKEKKKILPQYHFDKIEEFFFAKNYLRLLRARKSDPNKEKELDE